MRKAIWVGALLVLAVWSLLAWGAHVTVSGSGDWLTGLSSQFVFSASLEAWLDAAFHWTEAIGLAAVWLVYGLGVIGLLSCAGVATLTLCLLRETSMNNRVAAIGSSPR